MVFSGVESPAQIGASQPTPVQADITSVRGRVINALTGGPISRALVQANDVSQLTDSEGRFRFDTLGQQVNSAQLALRVNKPGYYGDTEGNPLLMTALSSAQLSGDVTLRLYPEAIITGTLTTSDGRPLPHLLITARRNTYNLTGNGWAPIAQHQTNSRGEFRLTVPPGDYRIESGFLPRLEGVSGCVLPAVYPERGSAGSIHLSAGSEERIEIRATVSLTYPVQVHVDPPFENGMLPMMTARTSTGITIPVGVVHTSAETQPMIELPLGTYTLILHSDTRDIRQYAETSVTVAGPATQPAIMHLVRIPWISIDVAVDSDSTSDNKVTPPTVQQLGLLVVATEPDSIGGVRPIAANARGGFQSGGLPQADNSVTSFEAPPGRYRLLTFVSGKFYVRSATYGGIDLLQHDFVIAPGTSGAPLHLIVSDQTGSATGTTRLDGAAAGAWIYCVPLGPSATPFFTTRSAATGSFTFPFLPPGTYRIFAFENNHQDDYRSAERMARFLPWSRTFTVTAGNKSSVDLDTVPPEELMR